MRENGWRKRNANNVQNNLLHTRKERKAGKISQQLMEVHEPQSCPNAGVLKTLFPGQILNIGLIQNRHIIRYILQLQFSYFLTLSIQIF